MKTYSRPLSLVASLAVLSRSLSSPLAAKTVKVFILAGQSNISGLQQSLFYPAARHTRLSDRVSGRLARFMATPALEELENLSHAHLGYPRQSDLTKPLKTIENGLFYAGQGAPLLRHRNAADLTRALASFTLSTQP